MKISRNIEWLIEAESKEIVDYVVETNRVPFPYPPNLGTGYTEHIDLLDDIKVIKHVHHFTGEDRPEKIPLAVFDVALPCTFFVINVTHTGMFECYSHKEQISFTGIPGEHIFGLSNGYRFEKSIYTHEDLLQTMVFIPDITIKKLLDNDTVQQLYDLLGINSITDYKGIKFPQSLSKLLETCAPDRLKGSLRALHAQSAILQYLFNLHNYISSPLLSNSDPLKKSNFNIKDIYEELIQVQGNIPDLSILAKKYNITPAKLRNEFSKAYGQTIFSFLLAQRLDQARIALEMTNIPMKVLADRIGYSHVNHFITAFKNKYGITPGSLRKKQTDNE
jgi:AraC-like DNA-binding protein